MNLKNMNLPNKLTLLRIVMIPVFVVLLLWGPKPVCNYVAALVFIAASLTDTADGYIARKYNLITTFGKFMDPLADKLLVCSAMICLVDLGRIESWIVIIIIAREFIISGFRLIVLMVANLGGVFNTVAQIVKWLALAMTVISLCTYLFENRGVLDEVH